MAKNEDNKFEKCQIHEKGSTHMYNAIINTLMKYNSMVIQDDYPSWKKHNLHREAAKLLLIYQSD